MVQLLAMLPCSKKLLGLNPTLASFWMEFACVGSFRVLSPHTKDVTARLTDPSCPNLLWDGLSTRPYPASRPNTTGKHAPLTPPEPTPTMIST